MHPFAHHHSADPRSSYSQVSRQEGNCRLKESAQSAGNGAIFDPLAMRQVVVNVALWGRKLLNFLLTISFDFLQRLEYSCIAYHHIFAAICQFMEDILSLASVTFYVGDNFRASVPSKMSCFAARPQIEAHLVLADTFARNSHLVPRHGRHQEKDAGACATENCPVWKDLSIKLIRR